MARGRRGNGEGSLYRDEARDRWIGQITIDGKRRSVYGATREAVRLKLTAMARDRDRGIAIADGQQTVGQWLDEWLESKRGIKESSWLAYETRIRCHLKPGLGKIKLAKLTPRQVQKFYTDKLSAGTVSSSTVKRMHECLHKSLEDALHLGLVVRNAADVPEVPQNAKRQMHTYDGRQVGRLLRTVADDRLSALCVLVLNTAMREGELIALKWSDVDLSCGTVRVQQSRTQKRGGYADEAPKTESGRRAIPLTPQALEALKAHRARQNAERLAAGASWPAHDLVFTRENGSTLHYWHVRTIWQRWVREARLPYIRFHDLRHTAATWLIAQGVPPNVVQAILGHADPATTMRFYAHVQRGGTDEAMRVMAQMMRAAMEDETDDTESEAQ